MDPTGPLSDPSPTGDDAWSSPPPWLPALPAPPPPPAGGPPARGRRVPVAAGILLTGALAVAGAGVGAGVVILASRHTATTPPATSSVTSPASPAPSATATPSASSDGSSSSGTPLDQAAIEARVDPAVVDITTSLDGGGQAAGTGMVITSNGEVLTNNHVIDGATGISVEVPSTGRTYTAAVMGYDRTDDVALLQMQGASGLTTVPIGSSSSASVGDVVVALGNALGQGGTPAAVSGTITALDQTITASAAGAGAETLDGLIEVRASIQPGDSGGPVVDSSGRVIGMTTAAEVGGRFARSTASTTGYAIPIDSAMAIVHQIETGGGGNTAIQVGDRALLGVQVREAGGRGAAVAGVQSGSPAEQAGLAAGDVITSVGGRTVTSVTTLEDAVLAHSPGDRVSVSWVDASGGRHTATVALITGPPA